MSQIDAVQERYARFARTEAPHRSPLYARWAAGIAADERTAAILARIPAQHRQPPLVFAVTRMLGSGLVEYADWAAWLHAHADAVVAECRARTVQTNEPLRCAALLPALSAIAGPIALIEVGASAGLCLYPDRYSYRYRGDDGVVAIDPAGGPGAVVLEAEWRGRMPPLTLPEIVWRAGIDLQPRDARDPADRAWLTGLVWPGEDARAARVAAALAIAAADPPMLVAGDAARRLAEVAARAPRGATLVVTTPGVLAHVPRAGRERIAEASRAIGHWITMDAPGLHSAVAGRWVDAGQASSSAPAGDWPNGRFALAVDGRVTAAVDPLGGIVEPIGPDREWHPDPTAPSQ